MKNMKNSATVGIIIPEEFLGRDELTWPYNERYSIFPCLGGLSVYVDDDKNLAKFLLKAFQENDDEMWNEELLPFIMEGDRVNYQKSYRALYGKSVSFSRVRPKEFRVRNYTNLNLNGVSLNNVFGDITNFEDIVYIFDANELKWYVSNIYYNKGRLMPLKDAFAHGMTGVPEDYYEEDEYDDGYDDEQYYNPPYNTEL